MPLLEVKNLKKIYTTRLGGQQCQALNNVNFSVEAGEYVAIMGASGSGKTTLLNILASLDKATAGEVKLDGTDLAKIKDSQISAFRRENLGFVFQDFNLLDTFSIKDNILLPLVLSRKSYSQMEPLLLPIAKKLQIDDLLEKYPYEVSGGQKQRAAVARALITSPKLILADEPTGALDSKASQNLLHIFDSIHETGQTILMVTHSTQAASHAKRVLFIKDGEVFNQLYRGNSTQEEMFKKIVATLTVLSDGGVDIG
ncbi:MAG TPA: ABC transporter ATP-binding protein [Lachnospiraceae bacterium]|jgi:putative ABC transport system ATP-binding protein|nr:ABC transporter ATP-binding protein [Lachnospiraceae bacterium]